MNIQSFNKKVKAKLAWFGAFSAPLLLGGVDRTSYAPYKAVTYQ